MNNFNLLKRPIETDTIDSWAKWLEDVAKVATVSLPVIVFGDYSFNFKASSSLCLTVGIYCLMVGGKQLRKHKTYLSQGGTK